MSTVRGIDNNNDWLFGKGYADYKKNLNAVAQSLKTRLQSFLGDCFFASNAGLDWFNLLGNKNIGKLRLAISSTILNTQDVTGIIELSLDLDDNRKMTVKYSVVTAYGSLTDETIEV